MKALLAFVLSLYMASLPSFANNSNSPCEMFGSFERRISSMHDKIHPYNIGNISRPIRENIVAKHPWSKIFLNDLVTAPVFFGIEKLSGLGPWNKALRESQKDPQVQKNPFEVFLKHFGAPASLGNGSLESIPTKGPAIIYGLHPTGPLEVMGSMALALQRRPDVKIIAIKEFKHFEIFKDYILGVDASSSEPLRSENNKKVREEIKSHLAKGGAVIVFPSGAIGKMIEGKLFEHPFQPSTAKYGMESGATMIPFVLDYRMSERFYKFHPEIRFASLWLYSLTARKEGSIKFSFGEPFSAQSFIDDNGFSDKNFDHIAAFNKIMRDKVSDLAPDYHREIPESMKKVIEAEEKAKEARKSKN